MMFSRRAILTIVIGSLWAGAAQAVAIDLTPAEQSAEVQELLKADGTVDPDPGEPAGAIKAYLKSADKMRRAARRIEMGPQPGEPDWDPRPLLDDAVADQRQATAEYPDSRLAWQGLGTGLWLRYKISHAARDLRGSVEAYERTADLMMRHGTRGGRRAMDFDDIIYSVAKGRAALSDRAGLDRFFEKLKGTEYWQFGEHAYAMALGTLNDPRADQMFQRLLALMPPGTTLLTYVDYLYARKRYWEALQVFDQKPAARLVPTEHAIRGALLERLGRVAEARDAYRMYTGESKSPLGQFSVPDTYRISGSALQKGILFRPSDNVIPKPQTSFWQWLLPASAWAYHVPDPCPPGGTWDCKAVHYLERTIIGEAHCVNSRPGQCLGTVGMQRAVAWNIRTRVFNGGRASRTCTGQTQTCFNYAANYPIPFVGDYNGMAIRYYFVIDTGSYAGLLRTITNDNDRIEADQRIIEVNIDGSVPDPIVGACLSGFPTSSICDGSCSVAHGIWGSFQTRQSGVEFRGGQIEWVTGTNTSCSAQKLVPIGSPTGSACGINCFRPVGAICPREGWLERTLSCGGSSPYRGPVFGNFFWQFNQ